MTEKQNLDYRKLKHTIQSLQWQYKMVTKIARNRRETLGVKTYVLIRQPQRRDLGWIPIHTNKRQKQSVGQLGELWRLTRYLTWRNSSFLRCWYWIKFAKISYIFNIWNIYRWHDMSGICFNIFPRQRETRACWRDKIGCIPTIAEAEWWYV